MSILGFSAVTTLKSWISLFWPQFFFNFFRWFFDGFLYFLRIFFRFFSVFYIFFFRFFSIFFRWFFWFFFLIRCVFAYIFVKLKKRIIVANFCTFMCISAHFWWNAKKWIFNFTKTCRTCEKCAENPKIFFHQIIYIKISPEKKLAKKLFWAMRTGSQRNPAF